MIQKEHVVDVNGSLSVLQTQGRGAQLKALADDVEAQFLNEMLKSAGVGRTSEAFGGGIGEDQFSSFLTQEYAEATVRAGGIGLSESIYMALVSNEETK
ncbi:MAG: rod-binding protein [Pseudomonadota bacterium]